MQYAHVIDSARAQNNEPDIRQIFIQDEAVRNQAQQNPPEAQQQENGEEAENEEEDSGAEIE